MSDTRYFIALYAADGDNRVETLATARHRPAVRAIVARMLEAEQRAAADPDASPPKRIRASGNVEMLEAVIADIESGGWGAGGGADA
ncbi:MAG: hypothetical protein R6U63_13825 [Longimicrobiales bacterium]